MKDSASGFGLAAGLLACQGGVGLLRTLAMSHREGGHPTVVLAAAFAGVAAILLCKSRAVAGAGKNKFKLLFAQCPYCSLIK